MDERLKVGCVYCGTPQPGTVDHVPSRVLLDKPYPPQLPVVDACEDCNASFSLDEQYVACLLEAVVTGSADPEAVQRPKIRRLLAENESLATRIRASKTIDDDAGTILWEVELDRIRNVLLKLARGHAAYELYAMLEEPSEVAFSPFAIMSREAIEAYESGDACGYIPEIGSRAFLRALGKAPDQSNRIGGWIVVQPGRYRYRVEEAGGPAVQMVLNEYLACHVAWS